MPIHELFSDAWCGNQLASGGLSEDAEAWSVSLLDLDEGQLPGFVPPPVSHIHWEHPSVGWGVVLPDRDDLSDADKALGLDAPECLRELINERFNAPIFRYRSDIGPLGLLRRYFTHRAPAALQLTGARGMGETKVPRYLLIVGSPAQIPWRFQYRLQTGAYVGRLDLEAEGLENYISGLRSNWQDSVRNVDNPVLWAVSHGYPDISHLMAVTIAQKLNDALKGSAFTPTFLTDEAAQLLSFYQSLQANQPAFVLTTSHGATFPLDDPDQLKRQLGLMMDIDRRLLNIQALEQHWNPCGAIWYAHACCSAGADQPSAFQGLVDKHSSLGNMLERVAEIGPCTAPLPRQLLGAKQPLGAFIGHIEPTFDWTLRDPQTGQVMTQQMIVDPLYSGLHANERVPVGMAMDGYYEAVAGFLLQHAEGAKGYPKNAPLSEEKMLTAKLLAMDRLAMVTLGDPTVCLP